MIQALDFWDILWWNKYTSFKCEEEKYLLNHKVVLILVRQICSDPKNLICLFGWRWTSSLQDIKVFQNCSDNISHLFPFLMVHHHNKSKNQYNTCLENNLDIILHNGITHFFEKPKFYLAWLCVCTILRPFSLHHS